jgi:Cytochrome c
MWPGCPAPRQRELADSGGGNIMRKPLTFIAVVLAILALGAGVAAQSPPYPAAPPKVVVVKITPTRSVDGAVLYQAYCASCHGPTGRGDGPAAHALTTPVPDLTQYSQSHSGDCLLSVLGELQAGHRLPAEPKVSEQDLDMPSWGPIFRSLSSANPEMAYLRLTNVSRHVASIQKQK